MGRKINLTPLFIFGIFAILALVFYFPIFLGKIPFNSNLIIAYWPMWMFFSWEGFPTGVPFKFISIDEVREFFPLLHFNFESFRAGFLPLWNPYNFSGYPHFANWASAIFYPLNIFMFLGSKIFAFIALKISSIILSGFFTYLYLRSIKLDKLSAFFGGISFALSATILIWNTEIWQAVHTVLWLPLILFAIENFVSKRKIASFLLIAGGVAFSIMAGYTQTTLYTLLFALSYAIFRTFILEKKPSFLLLIILGFSLGIGIASVQIIPGVELFLLSPRREIYLTELNIRYLLPMQHIVTFLIPDFFGHIAYYNWFAKFPGQYYESMVYNGIATLVVASFSFYVKSLKKYIVFFSVWAILSISLIFNLPHTKALYEAHIPFLSSAIPIRIIFLVTFSLSVLSSFGFSYLLKTRMSLGQIIKRLLPLIIAFGLIGIYVLRSLIEKPYMSGLPPNLPDPWYVITFRNYILPTAVFIVSVGVIFGMQFLPRLRLIGGFLLVVIFLAHSFMFAQKYFVFGDKKIFYPPTPLIDFVKSNSGFDRYIGYSKAFLENNFATVYGIYSPEGYDPVNDIRYNEFLSASDRGKKVEIVSRSDAVITHPYIRNLDIHPFKDTNEFRFRALDLLGVKYVGYFIPPDAPNQDLPRDLPNARRFKQVWREGSFLVLENQEAFARAFLASKALFAKTRDEALELTYSKEVDLKNFVVLEENVQVNSPQGVRGEAKITKYLPNEVVIESQSDAEQFLVLTDTHYPGWEAYIDNSPTKIYRANYTFRAIVVPPGSHTVSFIYRPLSLKIGLVASAASIMLLFGVAIVLRKRLYLLKQ